MSKFFGEMYREKDGNIWSRAAEDEVQDSEYFYPRDHKCHRRTA